MTSPTPPIGPRTKCEFDASKDTVLVGDIADEEMVEIVNSKAMGVRTRIARKPLMGGLFDSPYKRKTWAEIGEMKIKDWQLVLVHTMVAVEPYAALFYAALTTVAQFGMSTSAVFHMKHYLQSSERVPFWMCLLASGYAYMSSVVFWAFLRTHVGLKPVEMKPWCIYKVIGAMVMYLFLGWSSHSLFLWGHGASWDRA